PAWSPMTGGLEAEGVSIYAGHGVLDTEETRLALAHRQLRRRNHPGIARVVPDHRRRRGTRHRVHEPPARGSLGSRARVALDVAPAKRSLTGSRLRAGVRRRAVVS